MKSSEIEFQPMVGRQIVSILDLKRSNKDLLDNNRSMAVARAEESFGGTTSPVTLSVTASGKPPTFVTMRGVLHENAV